MDDLRLLKVPVAKTGMLIRRPVADVFDAFVDPAITTKFWFTRSTGRLEVGRPVEWYWDMYGVSTRVVPQTLEPNRRILVEWSGAAGPTTVEWTFTPRDDGTTFVAIANSGFVGDGDALVQQVADSTQGFAIVLAGLKALLEHDVRLNLVGDRYPPGIDHD